MTNSWHFYPKNDFFMNSDVNKTFDEILRMSDTEFRQWVIDVRKKIVEIWDTYGTPPVNGYSEYEIRDQFNKLHGHPVHKMFVKDEISGDTCVRNTHNALGNACNSWFPTMMKTKINYGTGEARSIYDYMARDDLLDAYMPYAIRHFKKDSFYAYSQCAKAGDSLPSIKTIVPENSVEFIKNFVDYEYPYDKYDFWISEKDADKSYTGYNENLINTKFHRLTYDDLKELIDDGYIRDYQVSNLKHNSNDYVYEIRVFEKGQKIFPIGLKSFRISVCQYAVNFPPLIAKAIWEKYTEEFKNDEKVYIWDPSSGWGGRLLGALSTNIDRQIHYLGNDPNTDHILYSRGLAFENDEIENDMPMHYTKYDDLGGFYNAYSNKANSILSSQIDEWTIWNLGSEEMQHNKAFRQHKGEVSVVFTSPPYFHREEYSEDAEQSCHKFSGYEGWRDTFLYETLKTAYEWLRPGGYIVWNIADIKEKNSFIPLEEDSCKIMENLGFEYQETLKLVLGQMPGGNRTAIDSNGEITSTNKNSVRIDNRYYRYEPIFVYRKPVK